MNWFWTDSELFPGLFPETHLPQVCPNVLAVYPRLMIDGMRC